MLRILNKALKFMTQGERLKFFLFLSLRGLVALLDLVGILSIGLLATSMALLLTSGPGADPQVTIGSIQFPAISIEFLSFAVSIILLLFILKALMSILLTRQLANFLARIEARAAREIAKTAFGKGLQAARSNSREEVLFAVQIGSPSAFNAILNSVGTLVAEGFLFLLVIASFALVDPAVALMTILYFGAIGFLIQFFIGGLMQSTGSKIAKTTVDANSGLSDLGEVIREVSVSGRISFFYDRIYSARLKAAGNYATQFVLSGMPRYIVETALILAIALFVVIQIQSGDIVSSAATIGIFLSGGLRLTASLLPLQSALLSIKQSLPHASRALEMLSGNTSKSSVGDFSTSNKQILEPVQVSLDGVSFSYNESEGYTLREISLEISAGSQIAFIGTSGAGKSTLADIILGLLKPSSGAVSVHGLRPHELISLYPGALGYVPQKPGMVSGTIAENIALGVAPEDIDHKRLDKAISDAHLTGLINSLPLGVDTPIGKRHDELSGGQIQRIGLARALYTQPRLLVMDEATSALDAESESEINRALDEMRGSVTVILIAHRLNTIQKSDVVFLIEKGLVADSGTFPDLLRTNKTVMKLAKLMSVRSDEK